VPRWVGHADWSTSRAKRLVATAELRHGGYFARAPQPVADQGGLLERMHIDAPCTGPTLLGFDFPIGVPSSYADRAGIADFAAWLRALGRDSEFFEVAGELAEVSIDRPFFPGRLSTRSPGIKHAFHAALGLSGTQLLRRCDLAHCGRGPASELFWALGPQAVGKTALAGWRDLLAPALSEPGRRYAIWPFDGRLSELLSAADAVIVESYPADAYGQLGLRMGAPGTAKTRQADRRADGARLLAWCEAHAITPERELARQLEDGFGAARAGEDRFDATVGLLAMLGVLRGASEPEAPDDAAIRHREGWMFGRHAVCPRSSELRR